MMETHPAQRDNNPVPALNAQR
eukprot:COSAG04_NODE_32451_length_251_cov_0.657895_1_plen_21_part_10